MDNLRHKIVSLLIKVLFDGSYSNIVLSKSLENVESKNDKSRMTKCFYGVIERKISLAYAVSSHCNTKLQKLDKEVLCILYLGAYEILYMDSIPARATVNECVALCKAMKKTSAAGMVNAVLRKVDINCDVLLAEINDDAIKKFSVSSWLLQQLNHDLGEEKATAFLLDSLEVPPTYIHVFNNAAMASAQAADTFLPGCKVLTNTQLLAEMNYTSEWYVQDMSSQICAACIPAKVGDTVLDVCAAPGGKSFLLAERVGSTGMVVSCDISANKCKMMENTAQALGVRNQQIIINDGAVFNAEILPADIVLCDVPCSGFGVIRRRPEIKYKEKNTVISLPERQLKILNTSAQYVKKDGYLIYSTCTVLKQENEAVITAFLNANDDFCLEGLPEELVGKNSGMVTLLPEKHNSDGFFICKMRRK